MEKGAKDFDDISAVVRREVVEMERLQVRDFRSKIINYLEGLANNQQQVGWSCWTVQRSCYRSHL